jgi:site-specific DNA-methyltransferase (adenine-specific)
MFIYQDPVTALMKDVTALAYAVIDTSTPAKELTPTTKVARTDLVLADVRLSVGRYFAPVAPQAGWDLGDYQVVWYYEVDNGDEQTLTTPLYVTDEAYGLSLYYATVQDVYDSGLSTDEYTVKQVRAALAKATAQLETWTGRRFRPEYRVVNIDGCRIEHGGNIANADGGGQGAGYEAHNKPARIYGKGLGGIVAEPHTSGRWPANVVLDESQAVVLDEQSGETTSAVRSATTTDHTRTDSYTPDRGNGQERGHVDTGGASRFFYVAKAPANERPRVNGTAHPTVKPLDLMRWLVRLVTPPGGTVLEPFSGSGTTVEACLIEGFNCIAIEKTDEYLPLTVARIHRQRNPVEAVKLAGDDLGLFAHIDDEVSA